MITTVNNTKHEVRYFFVPNNRAMEQNPMTTLGDCILIDNVTLHDVSDDNLKDTARTIILSKPGFPDLTKTYAVVADVGLHKDCGGLGASHPQESVVLFRPNL